MPTSISAAIDIAASPERVFALSLAVDQYRGYPNWNPAFAKGIRIIEQTDGVGSRFESPLEAPGAIGRSEVVVYDPPTRMEANVHGGIFRDLRIAFNIQPIDAGSTISITMRYSLRYGPASWIVDVVVLRGRLQASAGAQLLAMKNRTEFFDRLAA